MEQQKQALQVKAANFKNNVSRYGVGAVIAGSAGLMSNAHAEAVPIDVTTVTATIVAGVQTVSAIGLAVLSLVVVIKVFKWARSAM